jgi:hypothetical protein
MANKFSNHDIRRYVFLRSKGRRSPLGLTKKEREGSLRIKEEVL